MIESGIGYIQDIVGQSYSFLMEIVNYICFFSIVGCIIVAFAAFVFSIFDKRKKGLITSCLAYVIIISVLAWVFYDRGIYILFPPPQTAFFIEFMHIIQFFTSVVLVLLFGIFAILCVLRNFSGEYGKLAFSAGVGIFVILFLHGYLLDTYGVLLIFPPTLW